MNETNEKTVQEIANLAWGEAYAGGVRSVTDLKKAVEKALEDNNLNKGDYGINVTESGVDIKKGWLQTKNRTVIKGDKVLKIGDTVNYDETNNGNVTVPKDVEWGVLGAEGGKVLITTTSNIGEKTFNESQTLEGGMNSYTNGINELNEMCEEYGKGKGAGYVRSMVADDIDKITGYDKTKFEFAYATSKLMYGEKYTIYWDNEEGKENYPYYSSSMGQTGNLSENHSRFIWNDGNKGHIDNKPENLTQKKKITEITNTHYTYYIKDMLDTNDKAYIMLFGTGNEALSYWLATRVCSRIESSSVNSIIYGFRVIYHDKIGSNYVARTGSRFVVTSDGENGLGGRSNTNGVRAVVAIEDNTTFTGSSDSGWNIK